MIRSLKAMALIASAALLTATTAFATTVTVYSNNASPGDNFTNPNNFGPDLSQAVGASGWIYNNVRYNGVVGVNTSYARSGNASVFLKGTVGPSDPSGKTSKADIEMYNLSGLGALKDVTSLAYDWIRDSVTPSGSTEAASNFLHPSLRLYISNGVQSGYLVFERAYNQGTLVAVPTDTWVTDDVVASNYKMWTTGSLPGAFVDYSKTLSDWQNPALLGNFNVYGISSGIGSGWGGFTGAVDNITLGFNGNSNTYNFETVAAVPLPAAAWMGLSLLGSTGVAGFLRKRRTAAVML